MTDIEKAPLLEAIFELRWGEVEPQKFKYSSEDQHLFVGKVSALCETEKYNFVEVIDNDQLFPFNISHRFRKKPDVWPCFQAGLGIFTVNQTTDGYSWKSFSKAIDKGLSIFDRSGSGKLSKVSDTLTVVLRMQNAFFRTGPDQTLQSYLDEHFHIAASLPESFFDTNDIDDELTGVNCQFDVATKKPKGRVVVKIGSALINDRPGIMVETLVLSKASRDFDGNLTCEKLLNWAQEAHNVQKHTFEHLINTSAYGG